MGTEFRKLRLLPALVACTVLAALLLSQSTPLAPIKVLGKRPSAGFKHVASFNAELAGAARPEIEDQILDLINNKREGAKLSEIEKSARLTEVARMRSGDMAKRSYFSHYTPEGTNVFDLLRAMKIRYRAAGENLAMGATSVASPQSVVDAWMRSPSHARNILEPAFKKAGVGVVDNNGTRIVTIVLTN